MKYFKRSRIYVLKYKNLTIAIILVMFTFFLDNLDFGIKLVKLISIYGLILQLLGVVIILIALHQKLKQLENYGLLKLFINPIKDFPLSTKPKYANASAESKGTSSMTANIRNASPPTRDIKEINEEIDILKD